MDGLTVNYRFRFEKNRFSPCCFFWQSDSGFLIISLLHVQDCSCSLIVGISFLTAAGFEPVSSVVDDCKPDVALISLLAEAEVDCC